MAATGLFINNRPLLIPGLPIQNFRDLVALTLKLPEDGTSRITKWVRAIVGHTTKGIWPQPLIPGFGPVAADAAKVNRYWTNNNKAGGAQLVIDRDGDVASMCDCAKIAAYHAGAVNQNTLGEEMFQEEVWSSGVKTGPLYEGELDITLKMNDVWTWIFRIQRQIQEKYVKAIPRLVDGGANAVGVYGHRDCSSNRGRGDPGDHFYTWHLRPIDVPADPDIGRPAAHFDGYEPVNYEANTDLALWIPRQKAMNKPPYNSGLKVDGVAGPATTAAVAKCYPDKPRGLWVVRPIDDILAAQLGNDFDPWKLAA